MQPTPKLTVQQIVDQEFKTAMRGYKPEDVDNFLDLVIKDYEMYNKIIEELQAENQKLKRTSEDQKNRTISPYSANTPDISRRLSKLENRVFGDKLYD
ncbi:MAG: cell division regulator GpsB [Bacilli bacterium]